GMLGRSEDAFGLVQSLLVELLELMSESREEFAFHDGFPAQDNQRAHCASAEARMRRCFASRENCIQARREAYGGALGAPSSEIRVQASAFGFGHVQAELRASPQDVVGRERPLVLAQVRDLRFGQACAELLAEIFQPLRLAQDALD